MNWRAPVAAAVLVLGLSAVAIAQSLVPNQLGGGAAGGLASGGGGVHPPDDGEPVPMAAYSVRRLFTAYVGNAMKVCLTASPSTCQNIDFTASGDLDVVLLQTFCVAVSLCSVNTWYDQSGHGNDVTQSTAANQPTVVLGVANGHAIVRFNGSSDYLQAGPSLSPTTAANLTEFTVLALNSTTAGRAVATMDNSNDTAWTSGSVLNASGGSNNLGWGGQNDIFPSAATVTLGTFHQLAGWMQQASGTAAFSLDNAAALSATGTGAATQTAIIRLGAGDQSGSVSNWSQSDLGEIIIYATDETSQRGFFHANQSVYFGTP